MGSNDIQNLLPLFLQKKMQADLWTHDAHFVVATHILWEHGFTSAVPMMRELIKANNLNMGIANTDTSGYHETLTWFYLKAIDQILKSQLPQNAHEAVTCVLHSEIIDKHYPLKFYDKDDLFSTSARREYLKPALPNWFPKAIKSKTIKLLSATSDLHQEFKHTLNDTVTMHDLIPYFGTAIWTDKMVLERSLKFQNLENFGEAKFYFIETQDTNKIVGQCGFKNINKKSLEAEFGIILHQSVWGLGVAKSCHALCLTEAFENVGLKRITFVTDFNNSKMQRFFEKHGIRRSQATKQNALEYEVRLADWPMVKNCLSK